MEQRPPFSKLSTLEFSALLFYLAPCGFVNGPRVWRTYLFDDAFMSFRYAEYMAAGHGVVWNLGGERVEGYSSRCWSESWSSSRSCTWIPCCSRSCSASA
jgi:hypothetical protein